MSILFTPTVLAYYSEPITLNQAVLIQKSQPPQIPSSGIGNGYCTDLVRYYRDIPFIGDAKTWLYQAKKLGYKTGHEPKEGAIWVETGGRYGHVAYVLSVQKNSFTIVEQNVLGRYKVDTRTIKNNNYNFIYE